ncbi:hypothetical protein HMPREF0185_00186 [Brevundimonas diminuta 470-4]|nr:hypothetical protein HMPREF0185_00186 [Brevundimonas diminuta 470-4]
MTLTLEERETLQAANRIKRSLNRERRRNVLALRPHEKRTRGRDIDNGFLAYLRRQPCEARSLGGCFGPIDPAHIRFNDGPDRQNPGGARKNHDRHANPLCRAHHDQQHSGSERAFWSLLGKDAYETAAAHYAAYSEAQDHG